MPAPGRAPRRAPGLAQKRTDLRFAHVLDGAFRTTGAGELEWFLFEGAPGLNEVGADVPCRP